MALSSLDSSVASWAPALRHLRRVEPRFAPLIARHGPPALVPARDLYQSLGRAIVYQQLSGKAAATILGRVQAAFGAPSKFPRPEALAVAELTTLRSAGLSQNKALALQDLAARVADGRLPVKKLRRLPAADITAHLLPVRGIGPWSVDMFLMFALARPDVWPVGDLGVRKGVQKFLGLRREPTPAVMERVAVGWAPWRSAAAWYMWRALEA